jgi:triosephosphate isomerase
MRRKFIAGNWKMNLNREQAVALAKAVEDQSTDLTRTVDLAVFPPSVYLEAVRVPLGGTAVTLGAQNMYNQPNGAFTGEISAAMLVDMGCKYVILGHSERRQFLGETDQIVNLKVQAALAAGLIPIVCVGELLAEREAGQTSAVIRKQFEGSLAGIAADQFAKVMIAYEPVWAIGTGKTPTNAEVEEVHSDLRKMITSRYNAGVAERVRLQYGGSVKPKNAKELLSLPNVDGALVGGASLVASDFLAIAQAVA